MNDDESPRNVRLEDALKEIVTDSAIHIALVVSNEVDADGGKCLLAADDCFEEIGSLIQARIASLPQGELSDDEDPTEYARTRFRNALRRLAAEHRELDEIVDDFIGGQLQYLFLDPAAGGLVLYHLDELGYFLAVTLDQNRLEDFRLSAITAASKIRVVFGLKV